MSASEPSSASGSRPEQSDPETARNSFRNADFERNHALITALAQETDLQRQSFVQRSNGLLTRASVLTAAASIVTGLHSTAYPSGFYIVSIVCAVLAAVAGAIVLIPHAGGEVNIIEVERSFWNEASDEAVRNLMGSKLEVLKQDEASLFWRARFLAAGFAALGLSLVFAAVAVLA